MSFNCPANNAILCDQRYELDEYYRQMCLALESKEFTVVIPSKAKCQVNHNLCPRYLAAIQQMQKQQYS